MGEPIHVYPDPNGGGSGNNFVPSDTRLAAASIIAGGGAVVTAAMGSGTAPDTRMFLVLQQYARGTASGAGYMSIHAADARHVAIFLFLAALSVVLAVINLVKGIKMKRDLLELSQRVNQVCNDGPPTPTILQWWRTAKK